ncbi:MAG: methyltransferase domain-containing protein, partial [Desulfomonilaceae bacterium]
ADAHELFAPDYAYFSSFSTSWLDHAERYVSRMVERFGLDSMSHVVEIAANDGYLLQYVKERGISCLGIEPTASTAAAAREKGIRVVETFFGVELALELVANGDQADLMVANNVLAHVPNINDFTRGFSILLKPNGCATFEFQHVLRLIEENQFDTIYHEHFSYLSLTATMHIFAENGLTVFDVEELPTHGGSLRVFVQRTDTGVQPVSGNVSEVLAQEDIAGIAGAALYTNFQGRAEKIKNDFVAYLIEAKRKGLKVAAYGAAAKGNTLLNFGGVRPDLLPYVVDLNPAKQGKYLPGSRVPIVSADYLRDHLPDIVVILSWNLRAEVMSQLSYIRDWDGKFVTAVPALEEF